VELIYHVLLWLFSLPAILIIRPDRPVGRHSGPWSETDTKMLGLLVIGPDLDISYIIFMSVKYLVATLYEPHLRELLLVKL
jgi:hypothetical protein